MNLFCFPSKNLTNIWAGIGAQKWAVAETSSPNMKSRITKSKRMTVGALGLLYCSETQSFTTPFLVYSEPDPKEVVTDVWPERWRLPFRIHALGDPSRQVHKDKASLKWPVLVNSSKTSVSAAINFTGTTIFVPVEITADDWAMMVDDLVTTR